MELFRPSHPPATGRKKKHFTKMQEVARKDVERAFGILQVQWRIVKNPMREWNLDTISDIMLTCIIMQNMIIENEQGRDLEGWFEQAPQTRQMQAQLTFKELAKGTREIESISAHYALRNDLMEHLWHKKGDSDFLNQAFFTAAKNVFTYLLKEILRVQIETKPYWMLSCISILSNVCITA